MALSKRRYEIWLPVGDGWKFLGYVVADIPEIRRYTDTGYTVREAGDADCPGTSPLFPIVGGSYQDPSDGLD